MQRKDLTIKKKQMENRKSKIENGRRCDNCFFSTWIIGIGRPMLSCKQKEGFVGRFRSLALASSCPNFYPSTEFKLGAKATRRIPLTRGKFALVDSQDYYRLGQFSWFAVPGYKTSYADRKLNGKTIKMHREIMNAPAHLFVDHINHNGLDNRKANLRLCTRAQNNCNVVTKKRGASKYKGVSLGKTEKKWRGTIRFNKKRYHLGYFTDETAAAKAYDKKASQLHGRFACLNFPSEQNVIPAKAGTQN
jgi:hypothetical protein